MNTRSKQVIERYKSEYSFFRTIDEEIHDIVEALINSFQNGGKLLVCGNGGSNADADHMVGELVKGFMKRRPLSNDLKTALLRLDAEELSNLTQSSLPAINLGSQTALITAIINDIGGEYIFSQQVAGYGCQDDIFLGISTSGNSKNVINAAIMAKAKGVKTFALTGEKGGKLKELVDECICVPSCSTPNIQEMHVCVYHAICEAIEAEFWDE